MENETVLILPPAAGELTLWQDLDAAKEFIRASRAERTRLAYAAEWRAFVAWCEARSESVDLERGPVAGGLVAAHLAALAARNFAVASIGVRAAAIAYAHKLKRLPSPTTTLEVKDCLAGIRRTLGVRPRNRKAAATAELIHAMLGNIPKTTLAGLRDRALIALGFASAMRRSELVALDVEDLNLVEQGARILIRRSKTDQTGAGQEVAIPHCRHLKPLAALQAWLHQSGISEGPIFRPVRRGGYVLPTRLSSHAVALIIKKWAAKAGLEVATLSGHSLRSGFVTECVEVGADVFAIAAVTRHKNIQTLTAYVRRKDAFKAHPGDAFL
jgi:integrase